MTLEFAERLIFVINPGGGSTKFAFFRIEQDNAVSLVNKENIRHSVDELRNFNSILDQKEWRKKLIHQAFVKLNFDTKKLIAIVSRGSLLKPLTSGTYKINDIMLADIREGRIQAEHASNLGPLIADEFSKEFECPAYIVDPPCTDELIDCARISGNPLFERASLTHALNIKHTARKAAKTLGKTYEECRLVVIHLGSGISITSHAHSKMIDISDSTSEGPFGTQRAGGLPTRQLLQYIIDNPGKLEELNDNLVSYSGLIAYSGSDEFLELLADMNAGNADAQLIYDAFVHQLVKSVGAFSAVLDGKVDAIVFTGGMAYSKKLQKDLVERCSWIAQIMFFPGEEEMLALASGAARIINGEEEVKTYS